MVFMKLNFLTAFLLLFSVSVEAQTKYRLNRGRVQSVSVAGRSALCGAPKSKWIPIKKVSNYFTQIGKPSSAHKSACSKIIPRGLIKSLSQLPDVSELAKSSGSNSSSRKLFTPLAVSGTAPTIPSISELDSTQLFWRTGVVSAINSGSPSEEQCSEFWGSNIDGQSSGQTACYLVQDVGFSFGNIKQAGNSLCYMKSIPTDEVVSSNAIRILSGRAPSGGVRRIFDVPESNTARIIQAGFSGESDENSEENSETYIRIASRSELDSSGYSYKYDIWDCRGSIISSHEVGIVKVNGDFTSRQYSESENGKSFGIVKGFLRYRSGDLSFDTSQNRLAEYTSKGETEEDLTRILITPNNQMEIKRLGSSSSESRKSFAKADFTGSSVADLRFLSGAIKMEFTRDGNPEEFIGSAEYRDTYYASAPDSELSSEVSAYSIEEDSFYETTISEPQPGIGSGVSCSPQVTVRVEMQMDNPVMQTVAENCEGIRLDNFRICETDAIREAMNNHRQYCSVEE